MEDEIREVSKGQVTLSLIGHCKDFGFTPDAVGLH